jgi:hypothetical protein
MVYDKLNDFTSKRRKHYSVVDESTTDEPHDAEREDRLVPMTWVAAGVTSSIIIGTILVWIIFGHDGIKPWATVLGFILGGVLSIIGFVRLTRLVHFIFTFLSQSPCPW